MSKACYVTFLPALILSLSENRHVLLQILTVGGAVGGVLTPEAIFLGTSLVLNRAINREDPVDIRRCLRYSIVELLFGGLVAFFVLFSVIISFANAFWLKECAVAGLAFVPSKGMCDEIDLSKLHTFTCSLPTKFCLPGRKANVLCNDLLLDP